ncbi:uncharacterized protein G2W53_009405 [Senna tora]|uniref:Uncharacterized protein n=1 Tax=Senna tora TaxID=362788 RepID=A0A834WXZ7_9FABA|nr:uncharacterized protein G2W53_009405 [Senna tora]
MVADDGLRRDLPIDGLPLVMIASEMRWHHLKEYSWFAP